MIMQLDFTCDTPIYKQIRDQLVLGIAGGRLSPGERLPTIRSLANEAGVNVMTVNKAYQLLKQEGHIATDRRGGTVVAGHAEEALASGAAMELRLAAASAQLSGIQREQWLAECARAYDSLDDEMRERGRR